MGLPDVACAVYRASQRPYRAMFEMRCGHDRRRRSPMAGCMSSTSAPARATTRRRADAHLSSLDRGRVGATFDQMAQSIANLKPLPK